MNMKRSVILLFFISAIIMQHHTYAQLPEFSIFEKFEKPSKEGEGTVTIYQPEAIKSLVGTRINRRNIDVINGKRYLVTQGYRVQAYSGNNQRESKTEAFEKQSKIKQYYPDITTYITYNAPFWKLHIGDYRFFEDAQEVLKDLKKTFPDIRNEVYIVKDTIRMALD